MKKKFDKQEALELYLYAYQKTPQEDGFTCMGLYRCQRAYLYAKSEQAIKSYKLSQNIIRFSPLVILPMCFLCSIIAIAGVIKYQYFHPVVIFSASGMVFLLVATCILGIIAYKAEKRCSNQCLFLNY